MRRADRLFQIVEILRSRRLTTAQYLADKLEVSVRTVYRDVADLQKSGIDIEGEAGVGYVLRHYDLAPLMFNAGELEAIMAGIQLAKSWMDDELRCNADSAIQKIAKILPESLRQRIHHVTVLAPDFHIPESLRLPMSACRKAINEQRKLSIQYEDSHKRNTERLIRPLGLVFWGQTWTLVAWCETREDFRNFRLDRIQQFELTLSDFKQPVGQRLEDYLNKVKHE